MPQAQVLERGLKVWIEVAGPIVALTVSTSAVEAPRPTRRSVKTLQIRGHQWTRPSKRCLEAIAILGKREAEAK